MTVEKPRMHQTKKPLTDRQRKLRAATCERLTSEGLAAAPIQGSMRGELTKSNGFPWLSFGIADTKPTVEEISALVRRPDSPGFVAVLQPTEFPFAVVEWRTFTWLLKIALDCEETKLREAAQRLHDTLPRNLVNALKGAEELASCEQEATTTQKATTTPDDN